jgi:transposase-like protein
MTTLHKFSNLLNLLTYFKDEQVCLDYLEQIRWNGELKCVYNDCEGGKIHRCANHRYKCATCKRIYSVKVGTIFEGSKLPLQKWYAGIYLITAHKKGISSLQLSRDLSITQKSAWFLLHRVRFSLGLNAGSEKLKGIVEADETFIGGNEKNKHKSKKTEDNQGRSLKTKSAVAGVIERGGELRAKQVDSTKGYHLKPFVISHTDFGSKLMTDEWIGYKGLSALYKHSFVKHNEGEYVTGDCHTNAMEGFWSLLKRGVNGIYHSVSSKHLQRYVDEFVFRYNTRTNSEAGRFDAMLNNISARLTYNTLINADNRNNRQVASEQGSLGL